MPAEVHEHYVLEDPEDPRSGRLTGYTVITRESEWDDDTRERALALASYDNGLCGCGCGRPAEETLNDESFYRVHQITCQAGRAIERIRRRDYEKNKDTEGWDDGLHYVAVPVDPDDPEVKEVIERGRRAHRARSPES